MPKIVRLDVSSFRGIRENVPLVFNGRSVLLFGENGSGKSSFVDALEKLLSGRVSTLDGRAQGLSSMRHGPNIRDGGNPPQVAVTFNDRDATRLALDSEVAGLPANVQEYLSSAQENLYILRRRQILDFIDAEPRDRYNHLRPFLPLAEIDVIENAMRAAREIAEKKAQQAKARAAQLVARLRVELRQQSLPDEPSEGQVTIAINQVLKNNRQDPIKELRDLDEAIRKLSAAVAPFGDLTRQARISGAEKAVGQLVQTICALRDDELLKSLKALQEREHRVARVFYESVLVEGERWIEEEGRKTCPLCEQQIDAAQVVARTRERLQTMHEVVALRRNVQQTLQGSRQKTQSTLEASDRALEEVRSLREEDRAESCQIVGEVRQVVEELGRSLTLDPRDLIVARLEETIGKLRDGAPLPHRVTGEQVRLQKLLASLPSAEVAQNLLSARANLEHVKEIWAEMVESRLTTSELEKQASIATTLHEATEYARKEEVQDIFDEVSAGIDNLYTAIHPDESHGGIRLVVRQVGRGSANLRADYYDRRDEDPRAYYSDAHLDTLGLCIFLALRRWHRKRKPSFGLMILDDVLTSVDVHHVVRLSELILREFADYQIFLTTHDRIWFEHLRDIQARCRVPNNFVNKVIHEWTLEEGPDIREPEHEREEIDQVIAEGPAEEIASMAGRLLEHILQEMRYSLRLSVPARPGEQYEIGDLWPSFYKTMRTEYKTFYARATDVLDALDVRWPLRNWIGAHRNTWARNVPRTAAKEFAEAVKMLFDQIFCSECRRFVSPSPVPLGQLACQCGSKIYSAYGKDAVKPKSREDLVRETKGFLRHAQLDTKLHFAWKREEIGREH